MPGDETTSQGWPARGRGVSLCGSLSPTPDGQTWSCRHRGAASQERLLHPKCPGLPGWHPRTGREAAWQNSMNFRSRRLGTPPGGGPGPRVTSTAQAFLSSLTAAGPPGGGFLFGWLFSLENMFDRHALGSFESTSCGRGWYC